MANPWKKEMKENNRIGSDMIRLDTVDSTNAYALRQLRQRSLCNGTVILADFQTSGRGQAGNMWQSETGKNLTFSIVLYPKFLSATRQFYLSMAVSNGIVSLLLENGIPGKVKWPNDICIHEKKIAGILIENALMKDSIKHSVTGIGLNVNQRIFPAAIGHATSMCLETGNEHRTDKVLESLLKHISHQVQQLSDKQNEKTRNFYLDHLQHLDEWRTYVDISGRFTGKIAGVAETGELLVMKENGEIRSYGFKEITSCC